VLFVPFCGHIKFSCKKKSFGATIGNPAEAPAMEKPNGGGRRPFSDAGVESGLRALK
jgi:hypothetical protein